MKILYVMTILWTGGVERQVLDLADALTRQGHRVEILILREIDANSGMDLGSFPTKHKITRLRMKKGLGGLISGLFRAARYVRKYRPDVVHSHMLHANMFVRLLRLWVPLPRVLNTPHNTNRDGKVVCMAFRATDTLVDLVTNVSTEATQSFIRDRIVPAGRIITVYNGISRPEIAMDSDERRRKRTAIAAADGQFVWLTVGRLTEQKDYPNLLQAFSKLKSKSAAAQLWIAGEGPLRDEVAQLVLHYGLQDSVRLLGMRTDVPELMNAADGFVLGSAWEGMPLVLVEAAMAELPIVCTATAGVRDILGSSHRAAAIGDPSELAQLMFALESRSKEERAQIGLALRDRVRDLFRMDRIVAQWAALYSMSRIELRTVGARISNGNQLLR